MIRPARCGRADHPLARAGFACFALAALATPASGQVATDPAAGPASFYHPAPPRQEAPGFAWVEDSIAAVLDLPPLRQVSLPEGAREIRVWAGFGIVYPGDLLRVVQTPDTVYGEIHEWWDSWGPWSPDADGRFILDDIRRWSAGRGCGELRVGTNVAVCRRPDDDRVDWAAVATRLDGLGAWERTFPWPDPTSIDGVWIDVEVLRGDRYAAWGWDNPEPDARGDEGLVAGVLTLVREVQERLRRLP